MTIATRQTRPGDARSVLQVHHAAVRGIAAKDYPSAVIEAWAPLPITDEAVERFLLNPDDEVRLVAEVGGKIVGMAAMVPDNNELRACYVVPEAARKGVGSALVGAIERAARERGLDRLELDASVTAGPFYTALGYEVRGRGEHILGSGRAMVCVKMWKHLKPQEVLSSN